MEQLSIDLERKSAPVQPKWPNAAATNQWAILEALMRHERLTVGIALEKYHVYALSQECGRLRKLHWPIKSEMVTLPSNKRVKEYWL